jgi:hypothetical protein
MRNAKMNDNRIMINFVDYVNDNYLKSHNYCKNIKDAYNNIEIDDYEIVVEDFCDIYNLNVNYMYNLIVTNIM